MRDSLAFHGGSPVGPRFKDLRFMDLRFMDLRFIDLRFIDLPP